MKVSLDAARLRERCLANEYEFLTEGKLFETPDKKSFYIFQDNGADVLAVAHLDTVQSEDGHFYVNKLKDGKMIVAAQLDDRLGAHVILDVLPRFGCKYDILLTTGEESGHTSGKFFPHEKQYNWMFSFDRMGADTVLYQYTGIGWEKALKDAGFTGLTHGYSSDISQMGHLNCKGVNFGVGYENYHEPQAWAWWPTVSLQVKRFVKFYFLNRETYFEHKTYVYTPPASTVVHHYPPPAGVPFRPAGTAASTPVMGEGRRDGAWWWDEGHQEYVPPSRDSRPITVYHPDGTVMKVMADGSKIVIAAPVNGELKAMEGLTPAQLSDVERLQAMWRQNQQLPLALPAPAAGPSVVESTVPLPPTDPTADPTTRTEGVYVSGRRFIGMVPCKVCGTLEEVWYINRYGACTKCIDALEINCPQCHEMVPSEDYSFRTNLCYRCLLDQTEQARSYDG